LRVIDPSLLNTALPLENRREGKVRDIYDFVLPDNSPGVIIVATDRVSVFDVVLANGIPEKGIMLTQISKFWFELLADVVENHLYSTDVDNLTHLSVDEKSLLEKRVMICQKAKVIPIECIVRGYLTGGGYKEYLSTGRISGIPLPKNLGDGHRFINPIFTPTTKVEKGHDEAITLDEAGEIVGKALIEKLSRVSLELYERANAYAKGKGLIIADTKFEFGLDQQGNLMLIDEVLTPDSSRYWSLESWVADKKQDNFDKQLLRNFAEQLHDSGLWDKTPPGPMIPEDLVQITRLRYQDLHNKILGCSD